MSDNSNPPASVLYELLGAMYIQTLRIYDVLCLLASENPKISELIDLHEQGKTLAPDPSLNMDDDD